MSGKPGYSPSLLIGTSSSVKLVVKEVEMTAEDLKGHDNIWIIHKDYIKKDPFTTFGHLVIAIEQRGVIWTGANIHNFYPSSLVTWKQLREVCYYSTDGRKTWKPCVKFVPVDASQLKFPDPVPDPNSKVALLARINRVINYPIFESTLTQYGFDMIDFQTNWTSYKSLLEWPDGFKRALHAGEKEYAQEHRMIQ